MASRSDFCEEDTEAVADIDWLLLPDCDGLVDTEEVNVVDAVWDCDAVDVRVAVAENVGVADTLGDWVILGVTDSRGELGTRWVWLVLRVPLADGVAEGLRVVL